MCGQRGRGSKNGQICVDVFYEWPLMASYSFACLEIGLSRKAINNCLWFSYMPMPANIRWQFLIIPKSKHSLHLNNFLFFSYWFSINNSWWRWAWFFGLEPCLRIPYSLFAKQEKFKCNNMTRKYLKKLGNHCHMKYIFFIFNIRPQRRKQHAKNTTSFTMGCKRIMWQVFTKYNICIQGI